MATVLKVKKSVTHLLLRTVRMPARAPAPAHGEPVPSGDAARATEKLPLVEATAVEGECERSGEQANMDGESLAATGKCPPALEGFLQGSH